MVQRGHGTADAKARLNAILATLAGEQSVTQTCMQLGVGERGYYKLLNRFLQDALAWFEPRVPGRPARSSYPHSPSDMRVAELEAALRNLRVDLHAARIREEIALVLPHLLRHSKRIKKEVRRRPGRHVAGAAIQGSAQRASGNDACAPPH
jgi:hypothetical protein